jgi:hypothetical protein
MPPTTKPRKKSRQSPAPAESPWSLDLSPARQAAALADAAAREHTRAAREKALLVAIKRKLPALEELLHDANGHWGYEDCVYRFYHQSFKVYYVQSVTEEIVAALRALAPDATLNEWFSRIVAEGTGKVFEREHNKKWLEVTRPMLEAFFHARYFLEMVCEYGRELQEPPQELPSGWAAVCYLYGLR